MRPAECRPGNAVPRCRWQIGYGPGSKPLKGTSFRYRGKPVKKIAGAFQSMRDAAGFGPDVTAYAVRHTIATELMARRVPELEIAALLGHTMPNIRTTGRYIHVVPTHLASAKAGLDEIATEIGRAATRPMFPTLRASCVAVPRPPVTVLAVKLLNSGAGEGIRTLDPNLGKVQLPPRRGFQIGPALRQRDDADHIGTSEWWDHRLRAPIWTCGPRLSSVPW